MILTRLHAFLNPGYCPMRLEDIMQVEIASALRLSMAFLTVPYCSHGGICEVLNGSM